MVWWIHVVCHRAFLGDANIFIFHDANLLELLCLVKFVFYSLIITIILKPVSIYTKYLYSYMISELFAGMFFLTRLQQFVFLIMRSFQEGSSHDRGLYLRSFEELFDLSNSDTTSTAHFNFYFTACELYNDQVPLSSVIICH